MAGVRNFAQRRHHRKVGLLLAFALVFAQLGAVSHLYSHLRATGDAAGLAAKISHACPDCQSFAPLLGGAGASSHALALAPERSATLYRVPPAPLFPRATLTAFRSRAPPLLA